MEADDPSRSPATSHDKEQEALIGILIKTVEHFFGSFQKMFRGIEDPRDQEKGLISLCFFQALMALLDGKTLSKPKAWRRLRDDLLSLGKAIHRGRGLAELKALLSYLGRHSKRSKRQRYPSTLQRIVEAEKTFLIRQMVNPATFQKMYEDGTPIAPEAFFVEYCAIKGSKAA